MLIAIVFLIYKEENCVYHRSFKIYAKTKIIATPIINPGKELNFLTKNGLIMK